ncbi:MAG: glycosyltransferase family 39 protein [Thermoleophilia bacterium]|jgi:4-amino-4-deoxy-L-arabinose transferase-like glycosyltransferase
MDNKNPGFAPTGGTAIKQAENGIGGSGNGTSSGRSRKFLALILLGALLVRVLATLTRQMVQFDETAYLRMAENLASGNAPFDISGLTATHFSPLLPIFITGVAALLRDYVLSGYVVVTVFGCLLLIPVYLMGKELFGQRTGLMAAALMAVEPFFVGTTEYIYNESLYIFFLYMGLYAGWLTLRQKSMRSAAVAGLSIGLAYLANPSAVFYLLVLLVIMAIIAARRGFHAKMGKAMLVFLALFSVCALPYVVFLHGELGKWTFSGKSTGGNIYTATHNLRRDDIGSWEKELLALQDDGEPLAFKLEAQGENPATFLISHPAPAAKIFVKQVYAFHANVLSQVFPLWLLPLAGLGLFAQGWSRRRVAALGYLLVMSLPIVLVLAMYAHPRFFMPFVPFAMMLAAQGWLMFESWGRETAMASFTGDAAQKWLRRAPWLTGAIVLLPVLAFAMVTTLKQSYPVEYKEAGLWLKENGGEGTRIMNREYSSAYYAGGDAVILPYADYAATTDYARKKNVEYLIVGTQALKDYRPGLERLLDDDLAAHPEWELVDSIRPGASREVLIFRIREAG